MIVYRFIPLSVCQTTYNIDDIRVIISSSHLQLPVHSWLIRISQDKDVTPIIASRCPSRMVDGQDQVFTHQDYVQTIVRYVLLTP